MLLLLNLVFVLSYFLSFILFEILFPFNAIDVESTNTNEIVLSDKTFYEYPQSSIMALEHRLHFDLTKLM